MPFVYSVSLIHIQHCVIFLVSLLIGSFRLCLAIRRLRQPSYSLTASHLSCLSATVYQAFLVVTKFRCSWAVTVYLPKYQRNYAAIHSVLRSPYSFIIRRLSALLVLYSDYEATAFECLC